ncbi:putative membrane protein YeaQ/YmgE (transglycosylase-associated protein family) [Allocatelliglobosispora scoriae]|uniref:Putative membrane protein YeaQ/YmgE (Transglycosylase-associated protein family) n=1 Tax=Allocatelliglobosispora scoriae TaxID=643052 RepID=A0A841BMI5_9ACTN|nr:GlsB/YeaQ/YmgE family stress response membrane protein [Allocatelliglobosispora scoriae]MBB5870287.1 putative membrane protein YeaQ/YmgE (transglycosylase-associated protein family) [Allocatelliglobosispora scoriae]
MIGTIIWGIIGGAIVGYLGRLLLPGAQNISAVVTIIVGILAATLGGILADALGVGDTNGIDWIRHIIQLALAVFFVWLATRFFGNKTATR